MKDPSTFIFTQPFFGVVHLWLAGSPQCSHRACFTFVPTSSFTTTNTAFQRKNGAENRSHRFCKKDRRRNRCLKIMVDKGTRRGSGRRAVVLEIGEEEPDSVTKTGADDGVPVPRKVARRMSHRSRRMGTAEWTTRCGGTARKYDTAAIRGWGEGGKTSGRWR